MVIQVNDLYMHYAMDATMRKEYTFHGVAEQTKDLPGL